MNEVGMAAALATFGGVWLGHVAVRKIEAVAPRLWLPAGIAAGLGIALEIACLATASRALSAALGILGVTLLWDALEFYRQARRVRTGHAPANPANPRHARLLAASPQATTVDLLDRQPRGAPYSAGELEALLEGKR